MHWAREIGEGSKSKYSLTLAAVKNWAIIQPTYRAHVDLQQPRGNEMGSVRNWLKRLSSSDHRKGERLEEPLLVAYYWDGSVPVAHKIRDISSTGFYLLTTERWRPGTVVTMTLQRSDTPTADPSSERHISVHTKVVRLGKDGVGFAFMPLEARRSDSAPSSKNKPADKKTLRKFMEHLKLDEGCVMIGFDRGAGDKRLLGQDESLETPGEDVMKRLKDESGQSLILAALAMTCVMGFVALAVDIGMMLHEKRLVQIAADSAAVAGASEINFAAIDGTTITAVAKQDATKNGFTNGVNGATVTVNPTPLFGPHAGAPGFVEAIVTQSQPVSFMALFKRSAMTVSARAVATSGTTNGCIYTLGTTGTDLSITGNSDISIATCGIINDSSSGSAMTLNGNVTLNAQSIGIVGGYTKAGNITLTPTPVTGIVSTSDPLNFLQAPTVPHTCLTDPAYTGNQNPTLSPGCYAGLSGNGNINLTLSPGLYVINGAFNFSGNVTISGSGVTLDLLGNTSLPGNVGLNLTAPTSGTYNGIVIFQPASNANALNLNGNSGSTFQGIVYAPGAAVSLTGNSGSSIYADFIAKSLNLVGNSTLNDYASINGNSVLSAVKLVE
jgi:Flp pilus assembly protein TadG